MFRFFYVLLIYVAVSLFSVYIVYHNNKVHMKSVQKNVFIVKLPFAYSIVSLIFLIFGMGFFVYCTFIDYRDNGFWAYIILVPCIIIGFCMLFSSLLFKITVDKKSDSFLYRTSFGKKHIFYYNHIQTVIIKKNTLIIKIDGKTLYIDKNSENYDLFYKILRRYK